METAFWVVSGLSVGALVVYLGHRLCLWLEACGHLYYRHKMPTSGASSCLVALQQLVEPSAKQIVQISDNVTLVDNQSGDAGRRPGKLSPVARFDQERWRFPDLTSRSS